jgi:NAD(P)H-hydrate epimerase
MANASAGRPLPYAKLRRLASAADMRRMDRHAIDALGLPVRLLMENAARAAADRVSALLPRDAAGHAPPVAVVCGPGNNGGDGLAIARLLKSRGLAVTVVQLGKPSGDAVTANAAAWKQFGETYSATREAEAAEALLEQAGGIVDAIFGTGLARLVEGIYADWVDRINAAPAPIKLAVDLPSGIDSDTGAVLGIATRCTHTITFQTEKIGTCQWPGAEYAGQVEVADVSIPVHWEPNDPPTFKLTQDFARAILPRRSREGHKGSFGHLLSICGSAGMGGAALLAGRAAVKSGAGLVTAAVPRVLRDRFLDAAPELMTLAGDGGAVDVFAPEHAPLVLEAAASRDAALIGCGLGRADGTQAFVKAVVAKCERPLLIDADGLNAIDAADLTARTYSTVITPHPGELSRLSGIPAAELTADRIGHARKLAAAWGVVLLLKGAGTVVADPSGEVFVHAFADDALATGGSGDVLSGIIGSLLAQGLPPLHAALLGTCLHGAARTAQAHLSAPFFSASDLIAGLDGAFHSLMD